jgi:hypothetical protein
MSEKDKKKEAVTDEAKDAESKEELTEDQLEAVAGGVLIGLNQPALAWKDSVAHKTLETGGLTDVKLDQSFKFIK